MKTVSHNHAFMNHLRYGVCALALAGAMLGPVNHAWGATNVPAANTVTAKAETQVQQKTQDQTTDKRKQITSEAVAALDETRSGLKALDENRKDDALAALERASGKLDVILARDPKLALAPTSVATSTLDVYGTVDAIKHAREIALDALRDGRVQDARLILANLGSENVISVSNIPLATYPDAIKQAVSLIDSGKTDQAKTVLQTALNTLVVSQTIIPLHVVRAQQLLKEAESLAQKKDRKPDESKRLSELLTASRHEIEMAEVLGYGTKKDYRTFYDQIAQIEEKTSNGKSGIGFFEKIKSSMTAMIADSKHAAQGSTESKRNFN